MKKIILIILGFGSLTQVHAQKLIPFSLPETGQTTSYTATQGEDADYIIHPVSLTDNGDGTITDNNTLLMWQMVTIAIFHSFLLLFGFRWPNGGEAALLVLSGAMLGWAGSWLAVARHLRAIEPT